MASTQDRNKFKGTSHTNSDISNVLPQSGRQDLTHTITTGGWGEQGKEVKGLN